MMSNARPELLGYGPVATWVGLSARSLRRLVARGAFPMPVRIAGFRGARFRRSDVESWLKSR
jgi:predicted DNA-binding transcriptional regulator AlpA